MKDIHVFWDTMPYLLANSCHVTKEHATSNLGTEYDPDYGGSKHPRKVSNYQDTGWDLIRLQSLASLLRKSNMLDHYWISSKILRKQQVQYPAYENTLTGSCVVFKLHFRRVRTVEKSPYYLRHVRPSVRPAVCPRLSAQQPLDGLPWNFYTEDFYENVSKIQILKSGKNIGPLKGRPEYVSLMTATLNI
jgi:hypothetical protein